MSDTMTPIKIEQTKAGLFRATSEEMVGLHVVEKTEAEARKAAEAMLADLRSMVG